jgi:hypothetical protein
VRAFLRSDSWSSISREGCDKGRRGNEEVIQ